MPALQFQPARSKRNPWWQSQNATGGAYFYRTTGYYYVQTTDPRVMVWVGVLYSSTNPTPVGTYASMAPQYDPPGTVS